MSGKIFQYLAGGCLLLGAGAAGAGAYFARQLAMPRKQSLAQEKAWETELGLWGEYDRIPRTNYTVAGKDGCLLHCEYAEANPGSRNYVILTHGYTSNRYGSVKYAGVYARLGFNLILYDCRGHGENAPAACSIGNLEAQDLRFVIEDAYRRFGEDIRLGLHGESMGSSTSLIVLKYHPKVEFVVADCSFASLYELMGYLYRGRHAGFLLKPVNFMMGRIYHFNLKQTCPRDALKDNKVPLCLIHGLADRFIPPKHSDELAAATAGYKEVHKVEDARHARSRLVLGEERYTQIVKEFLENISFPASFA